MAPCTLPPKTYELRAKIASYATPILGSPGDPRIGVSWEASNWIPACRKQEICKKNPGRRPHFWGHGMTPKLGSRNWHFDAHGLVFAGGFGNRCPDFGTLHFGDMSDQVAESGSVHLRPKPLQRVGPSTRSFIFFPPRDRLQFCAQASPCELEANIFGNGAFHRHRSGSGRLQEGAAGNTSP